MKKIVTIFILLSAVSLLGGCDFLRSLAGRPTSEDIEAKRAAIAANDVVNAARRDSLDAVLKMEADSVKAASELPSLVEMRPVSKTGCRGTLDHRYYMVIGAFSNSENAKRLALKYNNAGYESALLPYRSDYTVVAICPCDRIASLYDSFMKIQADSANCPSDMWVLVNE